MGSSILIIWKDKTISTWKSHADLSFKKRDKEYTSTLFSTMCIGPEKGLPDPAPIGPRWLPLPLPWLWSTNLQCFPWPDSSTFFNPLSSVLFSFSFTTWPYFWSIMDARKFLQVINRWQTILVWFYDWMSDHRIVKCTVSNRKHRPLPYRYRHTAYSIK